MRDAKVIERIWENLETLQERMTSIEAEGLTSEQLEFVDKRLSAILEETDGWFEDSAP